MKDHHRAASPNTGLVKDDLWLEHLESEIEFELKNDFAEDLELLLGNSKADAKRLASIERTRQLLKSSDDVAMPESGEFYQNLHDKIMAAVDAEELPKARRTGQMSRVALAFFRSRRSKAWPTVFGAIGLTMMLAFVSWTSLRDVDGSQNESVASVLGQAGMSGTEGPDEKLDRRVAMLTRSNSNEVNGFESEEDMVTDEAVAKMRHLTPEQVESLYRSLRE